MHRGPKMGMAFAFPSTVTLGVYVCALRWRGGGGRGGGIRIVCIHIWYMLRAYLGERTIIRQALGFRNIVRKTLRNTSFKHQYYFLRPPPPPLHPNPELRGLGYRIFAPLHVKNAISRWYLASQIIQRMCLNDVYTQYTG